MNVTDSVSQLTCLINGISMAGPHETVPLESCEHIARAIHTSGWLKQVQAEAWDEGHRTPQDREMDDCRCEAWYEHECACGLFGTGKIITPNPYRKETDA